MFKRRWLYVLIVCLLTLTAVGPVGSNDTRLRLKAAFPENFPPQYSIATGGEPQGFAIDVIHEVARLAGADIQFIVKKNWADVFEALQTGEVDLIPNQGVTEKRKAQFAFTSPVETFPVQIFVRKSTKSVHSITDLSGRNVGVIRLNIGETILKDKPDIDPIVYDHIKDALFDLLAGSLDAIVFPAPVLRLLARRAGLEDQITAVEPPLIEIKRAISVRKDNMVLLERLDNAVKQFVGSPTYETIYTRWYGETPPFISIKLLAILMGLVLVGVVIGMAFWRYHSLVKINIDLQKNIEERRRAETQLQEAHDRLEKRVQERTQALSTANQELTHEIDKRIQAETLLRKNEQFLASIFDSIQDGISVLTPDLQIRHTNKAMQTLYAEHMPLEGKNCFKIYRGLNNPCDGCPALRALENHRLEMQEVPLVQEGRETGVLEVYAFPMMDDTEAVAGVVEYVRDISERKRAETALADSEKRLADIIEFLPDPTFVINMEGRVIAWNLAMEKATKIEKQDMIGQGDYAYAIPFYGKRRPLLIDLILKQDKQWERTYLSIRKVDGLLMESESFHPMVGKEGRYFAATAGRLYDAQGNIVGAIETLRDITDAKRIEQDRERLITEMRDALAEIQTLSGLLPICASCKKIRDDKGYWNQIESYVSKHSQAQFSHSICPDCAKKLYPDLKLERKE